jgi:microcystin-dependent protein
MINIKPFFMFKIKIFICCFLIFSHFVGKAQSTSISPGNNQISLNSNTTNGGLVIPKISLTSNLSSASPTNSPAEGMLIYNIGAAQTKGFYSWSGTSWNFLGVVIPNLSAATPLTIQSNTVKLNPGTAVNQLITWDNVNWVNTNPKPPTFVDNRQPYLALNYCIAMFGIFPQRSGIDPFVGEIGLFASNFEPLGWAFCNGQLISIAENDALFALIGTTFGGDGQTTFGIPDLRGRNPIHMGTGAGLPTYVIGQQGGTETKIINDKY